MKPFIPSGFQVLSSPNYQWVILDRVEVHSVRDLCVRLNHLIQSLGYQVEDWGVNPIFIVNPGGWVMPQDQERIRDWLGRQAGCKYVRTQRDGNQRQHTMQLGILHESQAHIALSILRIL